mgnify:FL=1
MSANYFVKNLCPSEISEWFSERMGSSDGWTEIRCDYQRWIFWMENHPATDLWRMREIWIQEKMALCKNRTEWNLTKLKLCPIWNILFISWCSIRIHFWLYFAPHTRSVLERVWKIISAICTPHFLSRQKKTQATFLWLTPFSA